ncbi:polysaccharide deacetylase family protein [Azospirillum picis]|uniref:Chitooligosaccharide deacetylase n=1 Tax=Azospirillum picis TaxID=488438 RepID=A0ABU0ME99_9PROT|nr:polysaccharide deacetylase family protein [Azospirillum picis]MBP2297923.1 peptidoglycan/xylan/chitin deacetylase (PgdA/CDA1 family) [Azospirillum picis]MDQ0531761.1 peptidoglycan/xylan/chitin deacetylase (PgdA/CDA1 family) [Azospirillum picis]
MLRNFPPNAASFALLRQAALPTAPRLRSNMLGAAIIAGAVMLFSAQGANAAAPSPVAAPDGAVLQLGIYSGDGDAWWSWKDLQRRAPELAAGLTASVMPLDAKSGAGGVALYARIDNASEPRSLCRKILGAGFGCLVVDRPAAAPATARTASPAEPRAAVDGPPAKPLPPAVTVAVAPPSPAPVPSMPPARPAPAAGKPAIVPVAPAAAPVAAPVAAPAVVPTVADGKAAGTTTSVLAPIASAAAAPLVVPPSLATMTAPPDGTIIYSEEDARTMADIEQHSRRKGRLRSVMPDSRYDVMPATLKKENWNLCALTFDDGPHRTVTRQILDILNSEGVRATYFPVGRIAERQGDLIHDFVAGGHEIGNHSLTHSDLRKMDAEAARFEIAETNRILRSFGANPVLFRPPYGRYSEELLGLAREEHMGSVLWSVDTRDWKIRNADKIVNQIQVAGMPGNVFLMHSTYPTTAQALPRVIAELRAKGCEFVTLSEWLERARLLTMPKIVNAGMPAPATVPASRD